MSNEIFKRMNANIDEKYILSPIPEYLYHYTSLEALNSIWEKKIMWGTHACFLNDTSEINHGIEIITTKFQEEIKINESSLDDFNIFINEFIKSINKILIIKNNEEQPALLDAYIFSFCEDGNSLAQWRAYGSGLNKCSIGFKAQNLNTEDNDNHHSFFKVVYEDNDKKDIAKKLYTNIKKLYEEGKLSDNNNRIDVLKVLITWIIRFKNESFRGEKEWRTVQFYSRKECIDKVKFRQLGNRFIPYIEASFCEYCSNGNKYLPIGKIFCGPGINKEYNIISLNLMKNKYSKSEQNIKIEDSKLPYLIV